MAGWGSEKGAKKMCCFLIGTFTGFGAPPALGYRILPRDCAPCRENNACGEVL